MLKNIVPTCGDTVDGLCVGDKETVADRPAAADFLGDPEAVGAPHHDAAKGPLLLVVRVPV